MSNTEDKAFFKYQPKAPENPKTGEAVYSDQPVPDVEGKTQSFSDKLEAKEVPGTPAAPQE